MPGGRNRTKKSGDRTRSPKPVKPKDSARTASLCPLVASLDVDAEAGYLRKVRRASEVEDVHDVVDILPVEAAKEEHAAIREARSVIPTRARWPARDLARLIL